MRDNIVFHGKAMIKRINDEHRLIYKIDHDTIHIFQCRYHYDN